MQPLSIPCHTHPTPTPTFTFNTVHHNPWITLGPWQIFPFTLPSSGQTPSKFKHPPIHSPSTFSQRHLPIPHHPRFSLPNRQTTPPPQKTSPYPHQPSTTLSSLCHFVKRKLEKSTPNTRIFSFNTSPLFFPTHDSLFVIPPSPHLLLRPPRFRSPIASWSFSGPVTSPITTTTTARHHGNLHLSRFLRLVLYFYCDL